MATFLDVWNLAHSAMLKARIAGAIAKAALNILNENPATANHENRVRWAWSSLLEPDNMASRMIWGVVGNADIQNAGDNASDNDIEYVVNVLIDTYANGVQ